MTRKEQEDKIVKEFRERRGLPPVKRRSWWARNIGTPSLSDLAALLGCGSVVLAVVAIVLGIIAVLFGAAYYLIYAAK
jgi:hypothetical protein